MFRGLAFLFAALATASMARAPVSDGAAAIRVGPAAAAAAPESVSTVAVPEPLPFFYDLHTFRGESGGTKVVGAFAVQVGKLRRERFEGDVRYRFNVTLVVSDTAAQSVTRSDDSVYVSVPSALPGSHLLYTHVEFDAPPSGTTVQRVVMTDATTPGIGQLYSYPFPIPDYSGDELMLSDLAMGQPNPAAGWQRGDVTLALLPTSQFPGSSFDLYYEVYNLPFGSDYITEVAIQAVDESGVPEDDEEGPVRTTFSGEAASDADGTLAELRFVESSLDRGRYRITVTVTDGSSGQSATQTRLFEVRNRGRGATMVPARPASRMRRESQ